MAAFEKCIVGLGELLWDLFPQGKTPGGGTANFAFHVSQFGLPGLVASAIGEDEAGDELEALLRERGVGTCLQRDDHPTGSVTVSVDAQGIPSYTIHEGVAWDYIRFTESLKTLAEGCSAVSFGTLGQRGSVSRESIGQFLRHMPADSLRIFDINLRQHFYSDEIILRSLEACNILKINDEELPVLAAILDLEASEPEAACRAIRERYSLNALILTRGARDSYVFTSSQTLRRDTPQVEVADTVGAGDAFTGAFCAALLRGRPMAEAHALAVETAAWVCTQTGGMPPLPKTLLQKLRES